MASARWLVAIGLMVLATLVAVAACFGVWAKRQALETGPWVETSERLLENETIRDELGRELSTRVLRIDAVQAFLDGVGAGEREEVEREVRRTAPVVLGSPPALRAWSEANRRAHELLLRFLDDERDTVTINVRNLLVEVGTEAGLSRDLLDDELPPNLARIEVVSRGELQDAREAADWLRTLAIVLPILMIVLLGLAVLIAPDRRRALIGVGIVLFVSGILVILVRGIAGDEVINSLVDSEQTRPAAEEAWAIATSTLFRLAVASLVIGALLIIGAVAAGFLRRDAARFDEQRTRVLR